MKELKLQLKQNDVYEINNKEKGNLPPYFAFVTPPKSGNIHATIYLTFCRETLCEFVRQQLRDVRDSGINMNKLHLIAFRKLAPGRLKANLKTFEEQVLSAQHMLNLIEKHYGWPLTKVRPTTIANTDISEDKRSVCKAYYISANKKWLKSPVMLSLFTLIFRVAGRVGKKFRFRERMKDLETVFSVLDDASDKSSYQEVAYYRVHGRRWKVVLDNYDKLFGKRSMSDMYYPSAGWHFTEGINRLCDENSGDRKLNAKFKDLVNKAGV